MHQHTVSNIYEQTVVNKQRCGKYKKIQHLPLFRITVVIPCFINSHKLTYFQSSFPIQNSNEVSQIIQHSTLPKRYCTLSLQEQHCFNTTPVIKLLCTDTIIPTKTEGM